MTARWCLGLLAALVFPMQASAQANFYEGKTVSVVIGASGGSLEIAARLVARHLGKHLPGNPSVIVMNMPGAAGMIARNTVLGAWKQDGTAMVSMSLSEVPQVAFGEVKTTFDYREVNWVGSMASEANICFVTRNSGVENILTQTVALGALGPASASFRTASFVRNALNPRVKIISGYKGSADAYAAMERGEVDG
jgi:tripartite-type tricarboxylate transporter receptor subunit TctC